MTVTCPGTYRRSRAAAGTQGTCPVCGSLVDVKQSTLYGWPVITVHGDPRHPKNWTQLLLPMDGTEPVPADTVRNW